MSEWESPVLRVFRENPNADLVYCRRCNKAGHQLEWRWFRWGANGFCSRKCFEESKELHKQGKDWQYQVSTPKVVS